MVEQHNICYAERGNVAHWGPGALLAWLDDALG